MFPPPLRPASALIIPRRLASVKILARGVRFPWIVANRALSGPDAAGGVLCDSRAYHYFWQSFSVVLYPEQ